MLHYDLTQEDTRIIMTQKSAFWNVLLVDAITGASEKLELTNEEANALLIISVLGDEPKGSGLYEVIEPKLVNCKVRPIP